MRDRNVSRSIGNVAFIASLFLGVMNFGCWLPTVPVTVADAQGDDVGFGAVQHTQYVYLVLAAAVTSFTGTGTAAFVAPGESGLADVMWSIGGKSDRLDYCASNASAPSCVTVALEVQRPFFIVDPINVGTARIVSRSRTQQTHAVQYSGQWTDPDAIAHFPATPFQGIWVRSLMPGPLYHCAVFDGVPRCDAATFEGAPLPTSSVLGQRVLMRPIASDVAWVTGPERGSVYRCERTTAEAPRCVQAQTP